MAIHLLYGDSSSGKSTAIEALIDHLIRLTEKKARVYCGDGGCDAYNRHGHVDSGMIEIFDPTRLDYPMTVTKMISDGWWPKDWRNPTSKLIAPDLKLIDNYSVQVFEGTTVFGEWMLDDVPGGLGRHAADGDGFGGVKDEDDNLSTEDTNFKGAEGDFAGYKSHGANAPRHWQIIQRKLVAAIRSSKKFPGLTLWTAHPTEAPDKTEGGESGQYGKITGKKIIGPDVGGKAKASLIGKEFGHLLHFDTVTKEAREQDETTKKNVKTFDREYRLYTRRHMDPNAQVMIEYIAGVRTGQCPPDAIEDYYVSKEPGDSFLQFFQALKECKK